MVKYTEAILSNSARKLLWFEITKMLIAVLKNKLIVSFIIIFGRLSFRIKRFVSLTYRSQKNCPRRTTNFPLSRLKRFKE